MLAIQSQMQLDSHQLSLTVIHFHLNLNKESGVNTKEIITENTTEDMENTMENIKESTTEITTKWEVNNQKMRCTSLLVFQYVLKSTRKLLHTSTKSRKMLWKSLKEDTMEDITKVEDITERKRRMEKSIMDMVSITKRDAAS